MQNASLKKGKSEHTHQHRQSDTELLTVQKSSYKLLGNRKRGYSQMNPVSNRIASESIRSIKLL